MSGTLLSSCRISLISTKHLLVVRGRFVVAVVASAVGAADAWSAVAAEPAVKPSAPATVKEASRVLDLRTFPVPDDAASPVSRSLARLSYLAPSRVEPAYRSQQRAFEKAGWREQEGTSVTDQSATGTFLRDGFKVSVSVMPGNGPGSVQVSVLNHGNVDTSKLPVPPSARPFYSSPVTTAYLLPMSVEQAASAVGAQLSVQQWLPYGRAGDSWYFKRNAIRLAARVATAPAQDGKTCVEFSSELLSADLPAPEHADNVQYSDTPRQLSFDVSDRVERVVAFYRKTLAQDGWKPTTDQPVEGEFEGEMIFAKPGDERLLLKLRPLERGTRVELRNWTLQELAAAILPISPPPADEPPDPPAMRVEIQLPATARDLDLSDSAIEFTVPGGQSRPFVSALRKHLTGTGWHEESASLETGSGNLTFTKQSCMLAIVYADTGTIPAQISIMAIGGQLAAKKARSKP